MADKDKMTKTNEQLSKCCGANVHVGGIGDFNDKDDVGTHYFVCNKCGNACDVLPVGGVSENKPPTGKVLIGRASENKRPTRKTADNELKDQLENMIFGGMIPKSWGGTGWRQTLFDLVDLIHERERKARIDELKKLAGKETEFYFQKGYTKKFSELTAEILDRVIELESEGKK